MLTHSYLPSHSLNFSSPLARAHCRLVSTPVESRAERSRPAGVQSSQARHYSQSPHRPRTIVRVCYLYRRNTHTHENTGHFGRGGGGGLARRGRVSLRHRVLCTVYSSTATISIYASVGGSCYAVAHTRNTYALMSVTRDRIVIRIYAVCPVQERRHNRNRIVRA